MTQRERLFTNEYKIGDRVSILRTRHGWFDGKLEGRVVGVSTMSAVVEDEDGNRHEINHPRDLKLC